MRNPRHCWAGAIVLNPVEPLAAGVGRNPALLPQTRESQAVRTGSLAFSRVSSWGWSYRWLRTMKLLNVALVLSSPWATRATRTPRSQGGR